MNEYLEKAIRKNEAGEVGTFRVKHIALIRSQLKPAGPVYIQLAKINLVPW